MDAAYQFGEDGLLKRMTELINHPGDEKHTQDSSDRGNSRNGKTTKRLRDETHSVYFEVRWVRKRAMLGSNFCRTRLCA